MLRRGPSIYGRCSTLFLAYLCLSSRRPSVSLSCYFCYLSRSSIGWSNPLFTCFSQKYILSAFLTVSLSPLLPPFSRSPRPQHHRELPTSTNSFYTPRQVIMLARAARPKLVLAVPTSSTSHALKSPMPISPSPISPTVRNTRANQRGLSTFQQPTFAYTQASNTKSILKKGHQSASSGKRLQFREEPSVRCVTPVPDDYHGTYVKITKDERRWGKSAYQ